MVHSKSGLQAVILAGFGSRLSVLTEDRKIPKTLLKVANRPMLHYQLKWLQAAKVTHVLIVAQTSDRQIFADYLYKVWEACDDMLVELVLSEGGGSADALRGLKDKILTDFIVVSGDLIIDVPPDSIVDSFRVLQSSVTALFYEQKEGSDLRSNKEDDLSDFVGIDHKKSRLLYIKSKMDVDDTLAVRLALINKFPIINLHTQLKDAHLYVFSRWVMDLIISKKTIASIKSDLIPMLVKCQFDKRYLKQENMEKYLSTTMIDSYTVSTTGVPDGVTPPPYRRISFDATHPLPHRGLFGDVEEIERWKREITCTAIVLREDKLNGRVCMRANTVGAYLDVNLKISASLAALAAKEEKLTKDGRKGKEKDVGGGGDGLVKNTQKIGADSMIGDGSSIGDRCSVKRSIIGNHCVIGKNCRISDSVVMDHVTIEDKYYQIFYLIFSVKLDGCVVCTRAVIGTKSTLKDCEVANGVKVDDETQLKGESVMNENY